MTSNMFMPSSYLLTDRSKAVLLLWIIFVICGSCLSLRYYLVCSLQPCGHLLGKDWPLGSLVCFVTFPYGVLGQVWYLIASSPDLCLLPFFLVSYAGYMYRLSSCIVVFI